MGVDRSAQKSAPRPYRLTSREEGRPIGSKQYVLLSTLALGAGIYLAWKDLRRMAQHELDLIARLRDHVHNNNQVVADFKVAVGEKIDALGREVTSLKDALEANNINADLSDIDNALADVEAEVNKLPDLGMPNITDNPVPQLSEDDSIPIATGEVTAPDTGSVAPADNPAPASGDPVSKPPTADTGVPNADAAPAPGE